MESVRGVVIDSGFPITVRGVMGTTFEWSQTGRASLLSSGIMIVEGAGNEEEARDLFRRLVIQGLGVPESAVNHHGGRPEDVDGQA
jgi:hypothetical protein